jgi:hypothetical protein
MKKRCRHNWRILACFGPRAPSGGILDEDSIEECGDCMALRRQRVPDSNALDSLWTRLVNGQSDNAQHISDAIPPGTYLAPWLRRVA